ncbi:MAG TPA: metallophosphoesterase, partial [Chromatiaceae bacterium]|nr:metallophosphoesterase [Chromatiaceae bacterium]
MRTLVVTDLHLNSRIPGLLDAQVACILDIFNKEKPNEVIIMGDVFMYRKPSPSELLALRDLIAGMPSATHAHTPITILRGNHDSETKADDGVTALSLFERPSNRTKVITHTHIDHRRRRIFIPHYENEETIISALEMVPEGYTVFGHFGYAGCLNSIGDYDSSLSL